MAIINPYDGVDWDTYLRIRSVSHRHLPATPNDPAEIQNVFNRVYDTGVRHFAISKYRPSIQSYPFDYDSKSFVYIANKFEGVNDPYDDLAELYGVTVSFDYSNDELRSGTDHEHIVASPNAEHPYVKLYRNGAWLKNSYVHLNGMGSFFKSGLEPGPLPAGWKHPTDAGKYTECIDGILANLQYPDGGGVIVNHPQFTIRNAINYDFVRLLTDMLDYNPLVLGTDIIESGTQTRMQDDMGIWDYVLSTGRRCWGFCQGDWETNGKYYGRNDLLIPSDSYSSKSNAEHECLKAYRNGAFFGRYANTDLTFSRISFENHIYTVEVFGSDKLYVVVDGEQTAYDEQSVSVSIPQDATYVRSWAVKGDPGDPVPSEYTYDDVIISQPIIINPREYPYNPAYDEPKQSKIRARRYWLFA